MSPIQPRPEWHGIKLRFVEEEGGARVTEAESPVSVPAGRRRDAAIREVYKAQGNALGVRVTKSRRLKACRIAQGPKSPSWLKRGPQHREASARAYAAGIQPASTPAHSTQGFTLG